MQQLQKTCISYATYEYVGNTSVTGLDIKAFYRFFEKIILCGKTSVTGFEIKAFYHVVFY